ncbi:hypothetical protein D1007_56809 [Hordeum vulgare]|nr:hypothetical protein D1007_56809 [Hordeum vulgare]
MLAAASASLGANDTLHAVAQCAPWNVTAAGCAACLNRSVRDVPDEDRLIRAPLQLQPAVRDIRSGAAAYGERSEDPYVTSPMHASLQTTVAPDINSCNFRNSLAIAEYIAEIYNFYS